MKGKTHKEYYVNYIATRDGVEKIESSHGDKPTRKNASELITSVMDQNIYDIATKENYIDYIANRPRVERLGEHGLFTDAGVQFELSDIVKEVGAHEGKHQIQHIYKRIVSHGIMYPWETILMYLYVLYQVIP